MGSVGASNKFFTIRSQVTELCLMKGSHLFSVMRLTSPH